MPDSETARSNKVVFETFKLFGNFIQEGKQMFSNFSSSVGGHLREVLGPVAEAYDFMKGAVVNAFSSLKNMFSGVFRRDEEQRDKEKVGFLKNIANYFKGEEKKDAIKDPSGKGSIMPMVAGILSLLGMGIGAILAPILAPIILPFQIIFRGLRTIIPFFKNIGKLLPSAEKFINVILKPFKRIGTFFGKLAGSTGGFGKLFRGILKGFRFIAWPFVAILGVIDFIKGYSETEGSQFEKIKEGIIGALTGFFELPIKILGKISDWILGIFGVKLEGGSAQIIMDGFRKGLNMIVEGWTLIFGLIKKGAEAINWKPFIDTVKGGIEWLVTTAQNVMNFFRNIMESVKNSKIGKILGLDKEIEKTPRANDFDAVRQQRITALQAAVAKKGAENMKRMQERKELEERRMKDQRDMNEKTLQVITQVSANQEPQAAQIPSSVEDFGIVMGSQNMM